MKHPLSALARMAVPLLFAATNLVYATENLSRDEQRMQETLSNLRVGKSELSDLKIEFFDGSSVSSKHYEIANRKLHVESFRQPGQQRKTMETSIDDPTVLRLLKSLIKLEYWYFKGKVVYPDAPEFLFRFYYKDLKPVTYYCQPHEYEKSQKLSAIRQIFLKTVQLSGVEQKIDERSSVY